MPTVHCTVGRTCVCRRARQLRRCCGTAETIGALDLACACARTARSEHHRQTRSAAALAHRVVCKRLLGCEERIEASRQLRKRRKTATRSDCARPWRPTPLRDHPQPVGWRDLVARSRASTALVHDAGAAVAAARFVARVTASVAGPRAASRRPRALLAARGCCGSTFTRGAAHAGWRVCSRRAAQVTAAQFTSALARGRAHAPPPPPPPPPPPLARGCRAGRPQPRWCSTYSY